MARPSDERWNELPLALAAERFSFVPGSDRNTFDLMWAEMSAIDVAQVARITRAEGVKVGTKTLLKYATQLGWTGRVVRRSKAAIVAMYLCEHLAITGYNDIKFLWVHPDYHETQVPLRLLQLARLELPEFPSRALVSNDAVKLHDLMRSVGWTELTDEQEPGDGGQTTRRQFYHRAVAGREYREALSAGGAPRHPAEGRDGGRRRK